MGNYDVAQICREGHITNGANKAYPSRSKSHCGKCGAATISVCPTYGKPIRGSYYYQRLGVLQVNGLAKAPAFCEHCGHPFPWTESRLRAASDLADQLGLTSQSERCSTEA